MNTIKRHARAVIALGFVAAAVTTPMIFGACTPGSEITASESDIVLTLYDNEYNFAALDTFTMRLDSIIHITDTGEDDPSLSRDNDVAILAQIRTEFEDRGYTWVDPATIVDGSEIDFAVLVGATTTSFYNIYSTWPCWGWSWYCGGGWYGGWPSTGVSYAYSTGTLITLMTDPDESVDPEDFVPTKWQGAINGILNDTSSNVSQRLTRDIDQMFTQSPYLKSAP
jgi:hypothetical protein